MEPPVSDHPKCNKDLAVANGKWSLTRIEPQGSLFREVENNLLHAISHLRSSMLSLKFFVFSE